VAECVFFIMNASRRMMLTIDVLFVLVIQCASYLLVAILVVQMSRYAGVHLLPAGALGVT
jgi:hypothetical protein